MSIYSYESFLRCVLNAANIAERSNAVNRCYERFLQWCFHIIYMEGNTIVRINYTHHDLLRRKKCNEKSVMDVVQLRRVQDLVVVCTIFKTSQCVLVHCIWIEDIRLISGRNFGVRSLVNTLFIKHGV